MDTKTAAGKETKKKKQKYVIHGGTPVTQVFISS